MSKETVVEKGQLSRSSTEIEYGATVTNTNEDSQELNTTKQQHIREKGKEKEGQEIRKAGTEAREEEIVSTANIRNNVVPGDGSRQIIAVSANKNPTAFFQLARKFLMTNETCDLSALEGAIVSAVDAAHLLERSQLASIVRIHTSYVSVEPKRRRQVQQQRGDASSSVPADTIKSTSKSEDAMVSASKIESSSLPSKMTPTTTKIEDPSQRLATANSTSNTENSTNASESQLGGPKLAPASPTKNTASSSSGSGSRELRRARILVTVKRTESYKRWLEENPSQRQAIIAGNAAVATEDVVQGARSSSNKDGCTTLPNTIDQAALTASSSKDS
eukprot:CAMPEP_0116143558 /NCGR_PEP_ID=MMETSP0329-20121206/15516_1 /TAXON_ID=697910 /ORGANISM="Pseudo-nitzschia arenysensis, Strain B593" /LENGTH=332 /DNA_ID=CAMNT_0003638889 /DNA_START=447 /DNA_END=1445 /DNA_ORIENTATION=+